jgi:hypothetical protein
MEKNNKAYLSASRVKTLENCAWNYWCNYHLKVPQKKNSGASRGTVCHLIFELLLKDRHRKHFDAIIDECTIEASPAVARLVKKGLIEQGFYDEENYELCSAMITVGLKCDFFGGDNAKIDGAETKFVIESKKPVYRIMGYMDKPILYDDKSLKIVDYKTSKYKFRGDELTSNVQAMMYTLAAKDLWPEAEDITVEFLFVKFPRSPVQQVKISEDHLNGFRYYLEHVYKVVTNFSEETARTNFAADNPKNRWLCKAGATWVCPYYHEVDYWVLLDENKKILKSSFENDLVASDKQTVEERHYDGCPAQGSRASQNPKDAFNF